MRFDLEVTIARPVEDVFAYVSDVTHLPEWQESAVAAGWIEPGKRFRERRSFLGRTAELELEVTACEPNRRFDVKSASGPVRFEIRHAFVRSDGSTQVTYAGHPLYYYVGDTRPGQILCQAVLEYGGYWYVVNPDGTPVR